MTVELTEDDIREILAGCENVTPGPWAYEPFGDTDTYGVGQLASPLEDEGQLLSGRHADGFGIVVETVGAEVNGSLNAAHIARLSPERVSALATLALEGIEARAALIKIAALYDEGASAYLAAHGSYQLFDEPGAVKIAREALSTQEPSP